MDARLPRPRGWDVPACALAEQVAPPLHASPLLSSTTKGWHGVSAELYRVREVDVLAPFTDHTVSMHFLSGVHLVQRRNGRSVEADIDAGDVLVTPAGESKTLVHEEEAEVLKVRLVPAALDRIAEEAGCNIGAPAALRDDFGTRDPQLQLLCRQLRGELERDSLGGRLYAESLGIQVALHLLRHYSSATRVIRPDKGVLPRHKLRRAIEYMNDHLQEAITLEGIANSLSMSAFHFAHLFKQTTQLSPHRYLIELRLERAKSLLRATELSVTEVAQQVGYTNTSHFAVAFHRATGVTPRQFRRID